MERTGSSLTAVAALLLATVIWASSFVALKYTFSAFDPMIVIFGRMAVAAVCFFIIYRFVEFPEINRSDIKLLLLMGFFEPCLYFIFEAIALENTTASGAGMITALLPLIVAIGARVVLKEDITRNMVIGFSVAIAGSVWLSLSSNPSEYAPNPVYGNFMEFMAMVCASGYVITLKYLSDRYGPLFLTAVQAFIGAVFFFPVLFMPAVEKPVSFELMPTMGVLYLGAVVTIGAYGLYNYGVSRTKASTASAYINLIPAFTIIMAFIFLGEKLNFQQIVAVGIVFLGVIISQKRSVNI